MRRHPPRLAWFTPLPPVKSGVSQYNLELLPALAAHHDIDVFVDGAPVRLVDVGERIRVFHAHEFIWQNARDAYDLVVYQLGNAPCHDYMWAYLVRYAGIVVLHDGQLHHARARALLQPKRYNDYRAEFWFNHPEANSDVAELGAEGLLGSLTYLWPMLRTVVECSRLAVVHNQWLADQIREAHPGVRLETVDMGVPEPAPRAGARELVRARHGIAPNAMLFVAFGKVTPEKRIDQAIQALAAVSDSCPDAHLLLAGETVEHYDPIAKAHACGIRSKLTVAGFVADEEIDNYLAAADVCLCMRWPSSRETSASWLRCMAGGRPTITTDLVHTVDVPMLDPRNWSVLCARADLKVGTTTVAATEGGTTTVAATEIGTITVAATEIGTTPEPVGVSIDILDEDHSLKLAMRRLADDARLREILGRNARRLWSERFRLDKMTSRYREVIDLAFSLPPPDPSSRGDLPAHLLENGTWHAEQLLREAGLSEALRPDFWSGLAE